MRFLTTGVVRLWRGLPREVGDASSLETFKAWLDRALGNLIQVKMSLLMAGGLDEMTFNSPFPPKPFRDACDSQGLVPSDLTGALPASIGAADLQLIALVLASRERTASSDGVFSAV